MNKMIRFIYKIIALMIVLCCLTSCEIGNMFRAHLYFDDIEEYMMQTPQSENVAYMDGANNIYFHDKTIRPKEGIIKILYLTGDNIFYVVREDGYAKVYKSNYEFTEKEVVLIYETDVFMINMPDEDKIFYNVNDSKRDDYYVKYLGEDKTETITKEIYESSLSGNDYYFVKNIEKSGNLIGFEITSKVTEETKLVNNDDLNEILNIEQAKKLNEYASLSYVECILKNDKIYIACKSYGIVVLFEYDFKTENVSLFDWVNSKNIWITDQFYIFVI